MDDLLHGILIGLLFGLPVGAVGTMIVQRTLTLTAVTNIIKRKTRKFIFRSMNRIFGTVLCLFGIFVLLRPIMK